MWQVTKLTKLTRFKNNLPISNNHCMVSRRVPTPSCKRLTCCQHICNCTAAFKGTTLLNVVECSSKILFPVQADKEKSKPGEIVGVSTLI